MDIKTKYFIGQEFFALKDNKIVKIRVHEINIRMTDMPDPEKVRQFTEYIFQTEKSEFWGKVEQKDCPLNFYNTKEELLKSL